MSSFRLPAFYPILDTTVLATRGIGVSLAAEVILEAGARILQFRHKDFFSRDVFLEAEQVAKLCHAARALLVVNDRADIAMLLGAGLHLGQEDLDPSDARKLLAAGGIIGFSTHNREQLVAGDAQPVDYLAIGPMFATGSKKNPDPQVDFAQLRAIRGLSRKPLAAIGGITRETARPVLEAGADSLAVIGDLYPSPLTKAELRKRAEEWISLCS